MRVCNVQGSPPVHGGNDPVVLPQQDIVFYIHTGLPGAQPAEPPDNPQPSIGGVLPPITIPGIYGSYIVAPTQSEVLSELLDWHEASGASIRLALTDAVDHETNRGQLLCILEAVNSSHADELTVDIVLVHTDGDG